jgi:hypothetical protein
MGVGIGDYARKICGAADILDKSGHKKSLGFRPRLLEFIL